MARDLHPGLAMDIIARSYARHIAELATHAPSIPVVIGDPDSIDAHNHERQFAGLETLAAAYPDARWLTLGDSGADAFLLSQAGIANVLASNLHAGRLADMVAQGLLPAIDIAALNAERIDLADDAVDFVLCRQAFHHFPRPMLAFYEMWRVARRGIVLIEPAESDPPKPLEHVRALAKAWLRGERGDQALFEADAGNFIYRLSLTEVWKAATALQAGTLFERRFNHMYVAAISGARRANGAKRALYALGVGLQDALARAGLMNWGMAGAVVLKDAASDALGKDLARDGWRPRRIPANPYL